MTEKTSKAEEPEKKEDKFDKNALAQFTLIYTSKDGRLCVFEDADGHLTAVRAEKLA